MSYICPGVPTLVRYSIASRGSSAGRALRIDDGVTVVVVVVFFLLFLRLHPHLLLSPEMASSSIAIVDVVVDNVVPPRRSSLTYRAMEFRHVRYIVRPCDTRATCSNSDLASVTSSNRA